MSAEQPISGNSLYLLYHELRPEPSSYSYALTCADFARQLELFVRLRNDASPNSFRPEITFDDGHVSNYDYALPALARHGLQAHFFITAGWIENKTGYMNWKQLRALHASGQYIGAHGMTHTLLTHCSAEELDRELRGSRRLLEDGLGTAVTTMSLPGGRYNQKVLTACREAGYTSVYTSVPRAEKMPTGELIGRLNIRGDMQLGWIEQLLQPGSGILAKLGRQYRIKEAAKAALGDRLYAKLWAVLNRQEPEAPETQEA